MSIQRCGESSWGVSRHVLVSDPSLEMRRYTVGTPRLAPLSLRFREIANLVGVALVLALMLFALRNDAVRMFLD